MAARIEIDGQRPTVSTCQCWNCTPPLLKLQVQMPATLQNTMNDRTWNEFTSNANGSLKRIHEQKRLLVFRSILGMVCCGNMIVCGLVSFIIWRQMSSMKCENPRKGCGSESDSSNLRNVAFVFGGVAIIVTSAQYYLNSKLAAIQTQCFDNLQRVCEQATQANEGVTFILKVEDVMVAGGKHLRTVPVRYVEVTTAQVEVDPTDPISTPLLNTPIGAGANFCPRCGNPCSGDAFCSSCGNKLS
eukprot:TRINITY_DN3369_c0_g1_i8.p1 TRINITY_DN3369_c0_g1~~TRINITY_DN3369_c0_g1_i8.p1  ORF type:complete len:244 (-),score=24.72 TRINITY_DN3369_c0_g1_i8:39-770(-)